MGNFVVTGGSNGIGAETVNILREEGHIVLNVDIIGGDINADLGSPAGREYVIREVANRFPDGLDGLVSNHGIAGLKKYRPSSVLSINYFGAIAVLEGLYPLLKLRQGSCVVTSSGSIANTQRGKYFVDRILTDCGDENRICSLVDSLELEDIGSIMYVSTKLALAEWVRRAAPSWGANGVNLNAVGPGVVDTGIMNGEVDRELCTYIYPMPMKFGTFDIILPRDIAEVIVFLLRPASKSVSGAFLYCDAGASAI